MTTPPRKPSRLSVNLALPTRRVPPGTVIASTLAVLMAACAPATPANDEAAASKATATTEKAKEVASDDKPVRKPSKRRPVLAPLPDGDLATVGDLVVTRAEFDALYLPGVEKLKARRGDDVVPDAYQATQRAKILEQLIWAKLLTLETARTKTDYDPQTLETTERNERADVRDWAARLAVLGQTPAQRHQMNIDYLRERVHLEASAGPLTPTEEEVRAEYEANKERFTAREPVVRASHLLFAFGPRQPGERILPSSFKDREKASEAERQVWNEASRARAEAMRTAVLKPGVDFNEFAKTYSEGPGAYRGGDMGVFPRRQMVKAYAEAAFGLKVGEVSGPVESDKGYYVIKLFGKYEPGVLPLEAVRPDIVRQLESNKYREARARLRAELGARFPVSSPALDAATAYRDAARGRARPNPAVTRAMPDPKADAKTTKGADKPSAPAPTQ